MALTCALNDTYIWIDAFNVLNALVRLCACALMIV